MPGNSFDIENAPIPIARQAFREKKPSLVTVSGTWAKKDVHRMLFASTRYAEIRQINQGLFSFGPQFGFVKNGFDRIKFRQAHGHDD